VVAVVGALVALVALVALAGQSAAGSRTVGAQLASGPVHDARLDDAFYRCLDVQARSLVSPGEPVALEPANLSDLVTLLKGVGSWVTVADPPSSAVAVLSLRGSGGPGACLGTVVVATVHRADGAVTTRVGTGASVPGHGPPPAPPL
jgi:hypothetical protein